MRPVSVTPAVCAAFDSHAGRHVRRYTDRIWKLEGREATESTSSAGLYNITKTYE